MVRRTPQRIRMSFEDYMVKVNAALIAKCKMTANDLPDYCYHDAYDDDVPPRACAARAIRNARDY